MVGKQHMKIDKYNTEPIKMTRACFRFIHDSSLHHSIIALILLIRLSKGVVLYLTV